MELNIEHILNFIFITIALYTPLQHFLTPIGQIYRLNHGEEELNLSLETMNNRRSRESL